MNRYPPPNDACSHEELMMVEVSPIEQIHPAARFVLMSMGGLLVFLLGIAASLTPSPDGYGTHRQLVVPLLGKGENSQLPACSFLVMTGKPCPSCGMTGTALGLCALFTGPWMLISGLRGQWLFGTLNERLILLVGIGLFVLTFGNWIFRLLSW